MPVTLNDNITWEESNQMAWDIGGDPAPHTASRWGLVNDGQDLQFFPRAMVGYSVLRDSGGVRRFLPEPHPRFPWLYARRVRFVRQTDEPTNLGPSAMLTYAQIEVEIVYQSLEYSVKSDEEMPAPGVGEVATELYRYVHRNKSLAVHAQPLPKTLLEFVPVAAEPPEIVPEPGSIFLPCASLKYTLMEVPCVEENGSPELPTGMRANIQTMIGSVNSALFDGKYSKGSLLFLAPAVTFRHMANAGAWCADVEFPFELRGGSTDYDAVTAPAPSWGHVLRGSGVYQKVRQKADHARGIYPLQDHRLLFWPF